MEYTNYAGMTNAPGKETEPEVTVTPPSAEPEVTENESVGCVKGRVFNCTRLNVRETPDLHAVIACEINRGTEVMVDEAESTDDFYKVCLASGIEGFCMKDYIKI